MGLLFLGGNVDHWLELGLAFLSSNSLAVLAAALMILAGAAVAYVFWFLPPTRRLLSALEKLADALAVPADGWAAAKEPARAAAKVHPVVWAAWHETEERVIPLPHGQRTISVMFGSPRDIWSVNRLLARQVNVSLAEAVPNLLVGLGLLLTFFFLTLALTQATSALVSQSGQQADLLQATRGLLSAAGAKFSTSLAGLLASIAWGVAARRRMAKLHRAAEDVLDRLGRLVPAGGGEMAMFSQLQLARELHQSSNQHIDTSKELLGKAGDHVGLTEELLEQSREQTGTFKRFETDLAVSLAGAITQAFSPQMEAMTIRLVAAIDGLSERIGTMNQDALQKMLGDFGAMLKQATDSEMTQLRQTLEALATRLDGAGQAIGQGASDAANAIDNAGATLLARVEQVSANLATGATNLESAADAVKIAMNDLDVTITEAAQLGKQGSVFFRSALEMTDSAIGRLKSVSDDLGGAATAMQKVSGQVAHAVDSVEELSREQRAVVSAVKEATPNALAAVQRVSEVLDQSAKQTADAMAQTKLSMESTAKALGATVASITEGVVEYSDQVATLHRTMDEHLSRAVGSLDKGVVGLEEAIEELGEVLTTRMVPA